MRDKRFSKYYRFLKTLLLKCRLLNIVSFGIAIEHPLTIAIPKCEESIIKENKMSMSKV